MRPLADAQRDVLAAMRPLPEAEVGLLDALGLVLSRDVVAPHDVPPFANSAMDGYAIISADTSSAPVTLRVLEDVPAGSVPTAVVTPGTAIKIMTGAPMPAGADTVAEVEVTTPGIGTVVIGESVETGRSVRAAGGDLPTGEIVFLAGERLGPHHLGVLATIGVSSVPVRRRPVVAVLSTGDEVMPPDTDVLAPGAIRDANRPMLMAMLSELGVDVLDLGIVPDDETTLRAALHEGAERADVVLTSGGVSMGEYDLVKQVLTELGNVDFWRVAMQPAKPFAFGSIWGKPLFGLPGNPVSVTVAFEQFARPALLTMMGARRVFRSRIPGVLAEPIETSPYRTVFVRVAVSISEGRWLASPSGSQSSNVLSALARADAFAVVPVGVGDVSSGDGVELEMFRWPEQRTMEEVLR